MALEFGARAKYHSGIGACSAEELQLRPQEISYHIFERHIIIPYPVKCVI